MVESGQRRASLQPAAPIAVLDVGTSRVKGALFSSADAQPLVLHAEPLPPLTTRGWRAEQSPEDLRAAVSAVLTKLQRTAAADGWRALALTTQRGTLLLTDHAQQPLTPLFSWLDRRGLEMVGVGAPGGADRWHWLQAHGPASASIAAVSSLMSWLTRQLTGRALDTAATCPPEVAAGRHPALQPGKAAVALPEIVAPGYVATVSDNAFALPAGLPLVVVGGDKNAELVGAGVVDVGDGVVSFGTALSFGVLATQGAAANPAVAAFRTPALVAGLEQWEVGLPYGGQASAWAAATLREGPTLPLPLPPDGPLFIPYLEGSLSEPAARAAWVGLAATTTPAVMAAAALEALVLDLCRQRDGLPQRPRRLTIVGGGAADPRLGQALADAMQLPIVVKESVDAGVVGTRLCAALALGIAPDWATAAARWQLPSRLELRPRPTSRAAWEVRLSRYQDVCLRLTRS